MASTVSTGIRRDIQFLRAAAVIAVVIFHFWPNRIVSGFLGVDVFFVISGFLITSLILREISSTSRFSITAFWVRRIRRIFPAAILVIAATVAVTYVVGPTEQINNIARHAFASAFSFENLLLSGDLVDYVHRSDSTSPLQHYWSLSVEEQFYVVWPALVLLALWLGKRSSAALSRILATSLAVVGVGSLVYAVVIAQGNSISYFDPIARAWELAVGAGVALWASNGGSITRGRTAVNRIGWFVLVVSFVVPGLETFAPGIGILPSAIATAMILATGPVDAPTKLPFTRPVLAVFEWVGDRSYSIYLWHWPIVIILPTVLHHELGTVSKVSGLALTLVLAELSYRFVENPLRRATAPWSRNPLVMGGVALVTSAAVVAVSFVAVPKLGKTETDVDLAAMMLDTPNAEGAPGTLPEWPYTAPYCDGAGASVFDCPTRDELEFDPWSFGISPPRSETCQYEKETFIVNCVVGDVTSDRSIAIVGDSHARAMWASMDLIGQRAGYAVHEFLTPRCSYRLYHFDWCTTHNREIEPILNSGQFDLVVLAQASRVYVPGGSQIATNPFEELWSELVSNGVPLLVIKDNPRRGPEMGACVKEQAKPVGCTRQFEPRVDRATQTALDLGIPIVNLDEIYCPGGTCNAVRGGMLVWRDNGHISPFFHRSAAPFVWSRMMETGLIDPR